MKIKEMPAYNRLVEMFEQKCYSQGIADDMPIYWWEDVHCIPDNLTPGHYVNARSYGRIELKDVPEQYRTREFFLHAMTGITKDIAEYLKEHPEKFDRQFFKDHIATQQYALHFSLNDFELMPLEFIDEEMVACAMFKEINARYLDSRGGLEDWFYSVHRRKPEVLTQDMYILGARCFAAHALGVNKFIEITPEEYRTTEYYFALCLNNNTPVMEAIPESVLTTNFLVELMNDSPENIRCFSEAALEREAPMNGKGIVKFWQAAVILNGFLIRDIPLNDERIEYFLSRYGKDSGEYEYAFKDNYKRYLRKKNSTPEPKNDTIELASMMTLAGAMSGMVSDDAIDLGNVVMNVATDRQAMLPIHYAYRVPTEYSKKYDKEEYLLEIYKKLGIQVVNEADYYYYNVVLPDSISIVRDDCGYRVKGADEKTLIHYYDRGPFYDRTVTVDQINVTL